MNVIKKSLLTKPSTKRVLIVDDDLDIADAIKYIIESLNTQCKCTIVNDPYEALLDLADQEYDLILMDQEMPGLYGSDMLKKADHYADHYIDNDIELMGAGISASPIPVVMISSSEKKSDLQLNFKNFNVTDYIQKKNLTHFLRQRLGAS